ncbi:hypothetical protein [Sphingomonas sp. Mn802worker]|uniref:hypothetical protein n=1 Tax=Sphingomonas sp. Mn802worker TaxID=629773 RepID=UPI00037C3C01|nr:hypothetical protein [Sphingomonas sp. Mn802worker]
MNPRQFLMLLLAPLLVAANGHDGQPHPRTAPELSDVALFVFAVVAVWLTRRALRRRAAARKD